MRGVKLFIVFLFIALLVGCKDDEKIYTSSLVDNILYFPTIKTRKLKLFGIENEGADWSILSPYYYGDFLKVSLHAGTLEIRGWPYFDQKITGYNGQIYLTLKGSYIRWVNPQCEPIPQLYWADWVDDFAIPSIEHIGVNRITWLELMNEPDTDQSFYWQSFGCWGTSYFDGQFYAQFVNYVYQELKPLYPNITIVSGAFMNYESDFLDGFTDAIQFSDAISHHAYIYCGMEYKHAENVTETYKNRFPDYEIYFSETGLIYSETSEFCDQEQAAYLRYLFEDYSSSNLIAWYTFGCNGWRNADLIFPCDPIPLKPAYFEYQSLATRH